MAGPSATDERLAERIEALDKGLGEFRLAAEKRFGSIEATLADIRTDLGWIKRIGGALLALLLAAAVGSGRIIWDAATIDVQVKQQGARLDKVERRLDSIDGKLDTLISRTAPKAGG